mgnify:CR=1 FL=1
MKKPILFLISIVSLSLTGCDFNSIINNTIPPVEDTGDNVDDEHTEKATLQSIDVSSNYREFYKDDEFVGEIVIANYSDGSSKVVEGTYSGYDMSSTGTQTVLVSYTDDITVTAEYLITVEEKQIVVTEESYKYTFDNTLKSDGSAALSKDELKARFVDGAQEGKNIVSAVTASTKVYDGKNSTLKISSSNDDGSFTLSLLKNVNKLIINAETYSNNEEANISVNNGTKQETTSNFEDHTFEIGSTTSVKINAENRIYIKSIEFFATEGGSTTEKTLSSITVSGQTISFSVGDVFSFNGTCLAKYSDGTSKTVTPTNVTTPDLSTTGNKTVTVTYTENGITKTTSYTIVVQKNGGGTTVDTEGYYEGINGNSTTLLNDLRALNKSKRKSTVGYKPMLDNAKNGFYVTDPGNGAETITTFYSGKNNKGTDGLNREHVWPNSRGGSAVENDIHMTRPTLNSENGNRGNSFYVEGKCSSTSGWDPAATSFGLESYRGDSARIIFYCVVASDKLSLVDKENDSTSNNTMGKLSDLIKWNLMYPVLDREKVRNDGAEKLQGNRNPFIDHPEYVCRIWGNYNSATKAICGGNY